MLSHVSPDLTVLQFQSVQQRAEQLHIQARTVLASVHCPVCQQPATRVHSTYSRHPSDLPCFGHSVRLELRSRRLFCEQASCPRQIFTERLPGVLEPYARKTVRLTQALQSLACSVGGEAGSRLGRLLAMPVAASTLLDHLRRLALPQLATPRILGVDDWAKRRGYNYATILVDLEKSIIIDLLDGRTAEVLQAWLEQHPGVEVISRDRSGAYAKGAADGAAQAEQVADRWHLLHNLSDALERFVIRHHRLLIQAAEQVGLPVTEPVPTEQLPVEEQAVPDKNELVAAPVAEESELTLLTPMSQVELREQRRQRRAERYNKVRQLREQGLTIEQVRQQTGLSEGTIRNYLKGKFPHCRGPGRTRQLDRWKQMLRLRWEEGCQDGQVLFEMLQQEGFEGSLRTVQRYIRPWRPASPSREGQPPPPLPCVQPPKPRQVVWWLLESRLKPTTEELKLKEMLWELCPLFGQLEEAARQFQALIKRQTTVTLSQWMENAEGLCAELKGFVKGLRKDLEAVQNAVEMPWSNGPTEGHINRLKTIKRQMYGRSKLDLLRIRLLCSP